MMMHILEHAKQVSQLRLSMSILNHILKNLTKLMKFCSVYIFFQVAEVAEMFATGEMTSALVAYVSKHMRIMLPLMRPLQGEGLTHLCSCRNSQLFSIQ